MHNETQTAANKKSPLPAILILLLAVGVLVAIDQLLKLVVIRNLPYQRPVTAIEGLLDWTYTTNTGGGFSILRGHTELLVIMTVVVMAALLWVYFRGILQNWAGRASVLLITAGGLGNMIDRVFRDGKVVDFIDVGPIFDFPIFNFADCCVTVGGVLFCVYIIFMHRFSEDAPKAVNEKTDGDN